MHNFEAEHMVCCVWILNGESVHTRGRSMTVGRTVKQYDNCQVANVVLPFEYFIVIRWE